MSAKCKCPCHVDNSERCMDCHINHQLGNKICTCHCHIDNVRSCGDCKSEHPEAYPLLHVTNNMPKSDVELRFDKIQILIDGLINENKILRRDGNACASEIQYDYRRAIDGAIKQMVQDYCKLEDDMLKNRQRIEELEERDGYNKSYGLSLHQEMINILERVTIVEETHLNKLSVDAFALLLKRIEEIEKRLDGLDLFRTRTLTEESLWFRKKPHKCPVCDGAGLNTLPNFQDGDERKVLCQPCEGRGIVWG